MDKLSTILKHKEVEEELYCSEGLGWLTLLLQSVDVTKPDADVYLMTFFAKTDPQLTKDVCYTCGSIYLCILYTLFLSLGD